MRHQAAYYVPVILLFAVSGCGNTGMRTGLSDSPSPKHAMTRLPSQSLSAFAAWKASPIKRCTLDDAFPGFETDPSPAPNTTPRGIDAAAIAAKSGGLPIVTDHANRRGLITDATGNDASHTEMRRVTVDDGAPADFNAELSSGNNNCTVKLFGQVVFDSPVFTHVEIGAVVDPALTAASPVASRQAGNWYEARATDDATAILQIPALGVVQKALESNDETSRNLVADALGVPAKELEAIVSWVSAKPFAIKLDGAPELPWIDAQSPILIATRGELLARMNGSPIAARSFYLAASLVSHESRLISAFAANLDLSITAGLPQPSSAAIDATVTVSSVRGGDFVPRNANLVASCATSLVNRGITAIGIEHVDSLVRFSKSLEQQRWIWRVPSVDFVRTPCEPFGAEFEDDLAATEVGRATVARMIGSAGDVASSPEADYQDWDRVAMDVLDELLRVGGDVDAKLNPDGTSSILAAGAKYRRTLHASLGSTTVDTNGERAVTMLAYRWALHPVTGYESGGGLYDLRLKDEDVAKVGAVLAHVAASCPRQLIDAADYFSRDLSQASMGWRVNCL